VQDGCRENFFRHGHGQEPQMHPVPEVCHPPGKSIYGGVPPRVTRVRPQGAV